MSDRAGLSVGVGLLVTGGAGRLATALRAAAPAATCLSRAELDVTDPTSIAHALDRFRPAAVINTAAMADVDRCEAEPNLAHAINAQGARDLAQACASRGVRLVHVSTDYVFGGAGGGPFGESDPPAPTSAYGLGKALGEQLVLAAHPGACIARVAWLFGHGGDFLAVMLRRAIAEGRVEVFRQTGSPTPLAEAAQRLLRLAHGERAPPPILHVAGAPAASRAEWLSAALAGYRLERPDFACEIVEIPPAALRPACSALRTDLARGLFGKPLDWMGAAVAIGRRAASGGDPPPSGLTA